MNFWESTWSAAFLHFLPNTTIRFPLTPSDNFQVILQQYLNGHALEISWKNERSKIRVRYIAFCFYFCVRDYPKKQTK